jgi:hypothetical protein
MFSPPQASSAISFEPEDERGRGPFKSGFFSVWGSCRSRTGRAGDRVLASADLIDRLELPPDVAKRSLGDLRLRGKGADLALYALTKAPQHARRAEAAASREPAPKETSIALS